MASRRMSNYSHIMLLSSAAFLPSLAADAATLEQHLESASKRNPDARLTAAELDATEAARIRARAALLPSLSGSASYARNQYESVVSLPERGGSPAREVTIVPVDQLDASITLNVPLFDGSAFARTRSAAAQADAARARARASIDDVLLAVVRAYHEAVSAAGIERAAGRSLDAARAVETAYSARVEAGASKVLELRRAQAEAARARQALTDAAVARRAAERTLATLSGLAEPPDPELRAMQGAMAGSGDDLTARALQRRPELAASRADAAAAAAAVSEARWAYWPTLSARATERFTNATGFLGRATSFQAAAVLSFNLFDSFGREAAIRQAEARRSQASLRAEQQATRVRDEVADALDRVAAAKEKLLASQEEVAAATLAARLAREALSAGAGTSVEVSLASRDAFIAEVNLARAQADAAVAAHVLRRAVGEPIWGGS